MRGLSICVLAAVAALHAAPLPCSAQTDRSVASTSKKGSLLIWPLVKSSAADTTVRINNEYHQGVRVRCVYQIPFPPRYVGWVFDLLPNQPLSWRVSTGKRPDGRVVTVHGESTPPLEPGTAATLSCWAVDDAAQQQIAWNWLSGDAVIGEGTKQRWQYSAWRFAVNSSTTGSFAGTAGRIQLTGDTGNYDACPTTLTFPVLRQAPSLTATFTAGTVNNQLTLVPCLADLTSKNQVTVSTNLAVRDENGDAPPGAKVLVGSSLPANHWFSESLLSPKLAYETAANPFVALATPRGTIVVHGRQDVRGTTGVPLIGVMSTQFGSVTGPVAASSPSSGQGQAYVRDAHDANTATPVTILWREEP